MLQEMTSLDWRILLPEGIIICTMIGVLLADLLMRKAASRVSLGYLAFAGVVAALIAVVFQLNDDPAMLINNTVYIDGVSRAFKLLILTGAALVLLLATNYQPKERLEPYRAEYYMLFLSALLGGMMLASSYDLVTLFVALELLSLSSYVLVGLRKNNLKSNEAALKYVVSGGISAAITLFGFSYIYGLTGSTNMLVIQENLSIIATEQLEYLIVIAFIMILVGVSFKIASVPFQMWAPDVYEGSTVPVTAFLSVVSKSAGFILLMRLFYTLFLNSDGDYNIFESGQILIGVVACITMLYGNILALRQRKVKRLMAYSGIAHAGYLLLAFSVFDATFTYETIWFYLLAYMLMTIGLFAIVQVVMDESEPETMTVFAGLYQRSPILAVCATIFILSLAGIPLTAGFIGKLNIFMLLLSQSAQLYVFAAVLLLATVISYVYYFGMTTQIFFRQARSSSRLHVPVAVMLVIGFCAVSTIVLGIIPSIGFNFLSGILS